MPYVTPAELAERPGPFELAQVAGTREQPVAEALMNATLRGAGRSAWTPEEQAAADAALARIMNAVAQADATIDGFLARRGWPLPLALPAASGARGLLAGWSRAGARYLLNKDRLSDEDKDPVARDWRDALRLLGLLAQGKFSLGADDPGAPRASTDVRFASAPAVFSRARLHAFR